MGLDEEIAAVAYELFERDGRVDGKDREHWLEAEEIVKARHGAEQGSRKGKTNIPTASPAAKAKKAPAAKKTSPKSSASATKGKAKEQKE
jgi:hypothetical protein